MSCKLSRLEKSSSDWLKSSRAVIQHVSEKRCDFGVFYRAVEKH